MIGIFNISKRLSESLSDHFTVVDLDEVTPVPETPPEVKLEALLIGWTPRSKNLDKIKAKTLLKQTSILEKYIKEKLPIIVFDGYMSISRKELVWLKKHGVKLFEPALNYRKDFRYLPHSLKIKSLEEIELNPDIRKYPLAWKGRLSDKVKGFEKYYTNYARLYPQDYNVLYSDNNLENFKKEEYENINVEYRDNIDFQDVKCCIIIGSKKEYRIGYLNPLFIEALENNVIPLIARENRYFSGLPTTICTPSQIPFYTDSYEATYIGYLVDIYESIKKFYPEFDINYTIDLIKGEIS